MQKNYYFSFKKDGEQRLSEKDNSNLISIIIPTYNEKDNLQKIIKDIFSILKKKEINGEVVVVDDNSPDGTGKIAENLSKNYNLKIVNRPEKAGLASAVIDGIKEARGEIIGIMDADLSHDPEIIPKIIDGITKQKNELVVASRYVKGGKIENWPFTRKLISWIAIVAASPFTKIKDRTSGYLFFKKQILEGVNINPRGFKIGLEIMVKGHYKRWKEIPYTFKDRNKGESKFNLNEVKKYLEQLTSYIFKR